MCYCGEKLVNESLSMVTPLGHYMPFTETKWKTLYLGLKYKKNNENERLKKHPNLYGE